MNIVVLVKQVPDTETKVVPNSDKSYIETQGIKWIMNPYDEFAVEQALLTKEANAGSKVTALRVGSVKDTEVLRTAMAMGADDSILVEAPDNLDAYSTAKAIVGALKKSDNPPDIVFAGKQAIDSDNLIVPQLVAQMLKVPSVSVVVNCDVKDNKVTLKREIDGGALEVYEAETPILISCNKGLNTPRYASLPGIMKAKRKPLLKMSLEEAGITAEDSKVSYSDFRLPPEKPPGKKFDAMDEANQGQVVKEVVDLLINEAKAL